MSKVRRRAITLMLRLLLNTDEEVVSYRYEVTASNKIIVTRSLDLWSEAFEFSDRNKRTVFIDDKPYHILGNSRSGYLLTDNGNRRCYIVVLKNLGIDDEVYELVIRRLIDAEYLVKKLDRILTSALIDENPFEPAPCELVMAANEDEALTIVKQKQFIKMITDEQASTEAR